VTARRYRTEIAGVLRVGLEFDSEAELEDFLAARGIVLVLAESAGAAAPQICAESEPRHMGRPSHDDLIAQAIDELGEQLEERDSIAAQARLVRDHLTGDDRPALRTIEIWLSTYRRPGTRKFPRKLTVG
jgi:hypothetical protein